MKKKSGTVRRQGLRTSLLVILLATGALPLFPASFRFVPTSLTLDAKSRTATLTIENTGDEKVTVQLQMMKWTQDGRGNELYEPTKDLVFFPQILSIEPGKQGTIRVGAEMREELTVEKSYRLFVQELPLGKPGESLIKTLVRVGMPVFMTPRVQRETLAVESIGVTDGKLQIRIRNSGTAHAMIRTIRVTGLDSSGKEIFSKESSGWYVLPGVSRAFPIEVTREDCAPMSTMKIVATAGEGAVEGQVAVDAALCAQLAKRRNEENADRELPPPEKP
jgi:fimbrial chaperone protein